MQIGFTLKAEGVVMKKIGIISVLFTGILLLGACSNSKNDTEINKLKTENSKLKARNEKLNEQIASYENKKSTKSEEKKSSASNDQKIDSTKKSLNETVPFGTSDKELFKLKITKVSSNQESFPSYMSSSVNNFDISKMIAISIEYTNVAYGKGYLPDTYNFQAYSKDGKTLERVDQQDGQDRVPDGRTGTTTIFFKTNSESSSINQIELDFMDSSNGKKLSTFDLPVSH